MFLCHRVRTQRGIFLRMARNSCFVLVMAQLSVAALFASGCVATSDCWDSFFSFPVSILVDVIHRNYISFSALFRRQILISKKHISHIFFISNLTPSQVIWHSPKKECLSSQRLRSIKPKVWVSHLDLNSSRSIPAPKTEHPIISWRIIV